ncbi:predicted protein [Sclerotinia sclerotiorum 1980 UF-70]|uniref:Uncharacterized protein n=2 Tax=Sclerotinia sclerotiorum (strain ATCC 18683 / 1980 / Ss-1) TaxID=665079 RepID=A7EXR4_SCLS1|nr:predicted protein [Sclerotinia sclerotiorum 1980 UF-70]APA16019.1 hypothetical protein sscle_16g107890 [Sclerotinia sclerotiorum 1980 UF-70]EDN94256.1 predicted protein [Sclerotinia sclerotiorum 1980 UF-70]
MKTISFIALVAYLAYEASALPVAKSDKPVRTDNGVTKHVFKKAEAETPAPPIYGYGREKRDETPAPLLYGYGQEKRAEAVAPAPLIYGYGREKREESATPGPLIYGYGKE